MKKIAVVGGLGTLAGADLFFKLLKDKKVLANQLDYRFIFEQEPYRQMNSVLHIEDDIKSRKFYSFTICKKFESQDVSAILIPCFASHSFLPELQTEVDVPIVSILDAVKSYVDRRCKPGDKIGILASTYVKSLSMMQACLSGHTLVFPESQERVMQAIYAPDGIKQGNSTGLAVEYLAQACDELVAEGCVLIVPATTEVSLVADQLWKRGYPVLDVNQLYADYALSNEAQRQTPPFKIGILGGVGPSATVDFMNKIIKHTPATTDQEHIKMVVEQNPQIPDRTDHLINQATDLTIAMFATCKRLQAEGADAIAIPCNTAHAFVASIQQHLHIPIINMLTVTAQHILTQFGPSTTVGLLATSGTISSGVYHEALQELGLPMVVPTEAAQALVMESIYGAAGVKAGYSEGLCKEQIRQAAQHLVARGADIIILGCTELPLLFIGEEQLLQDGRCTPLVDPTAILAKEVVKLAQQHQ